MSETILGWHFCAEDRKLGYDDGRLIVEGETLSVDCEPVLCEQGLHASERIIDALRYAPGPVICRVELSGSIVRGDDKAVATHRKTLWMFDATNALRDFAATVTENALLAERAAGREPDPRSWAAVQFVRDLLDGKIKEEDQEAAAESVRSATWAAAESASDEAWAAARYAVSATWAGESVVMSWAAPWSARAEQNVLLLQIIEKWRNK